ncbi:hemerythrin domain-containing protein [Planotetraspora phitsanulokensis]|uniref:hemerythrin domain-containing protein n=1 Tax=Planotetraspora phitsanulokensis TaxID=575192 RepID=UPI00194ECD50|nr:hemerythrin domain-containing protein [Planotetraspora phitsanulokensis]
MGITSGPYFDGREMYMLHDMFRREFGLMPGLVRGVTAGDLERAQIIASHVESVSTLLHHHHHSEDEFVWPMLAERVPAELEPFVHLMEDQHEKVAKVAAEVDEAIAAWRDLATGESRQVLAEALDRLLPLLREHLEAEEEHVVPLMESHITATEWNQMVQAGAAQADPEGLPLGFGMLMYEGDPEVVDIAIANMPPEARPLIRQVATEAFAAYAERVHGTPTPPRSTEV